MALEAERFLAWRQVKDLTGLGRTTAWRLRQAGDFPEPVPLSPGRVAWRERDIAAWNESRGTPALGRETRPGLSAPCAPMQTLVSPPTAGPTPSPVFPIARSRLRRRSGPRVAEGQLDFDV
jgi:predicted DNA-binding transcriptional regulator AlpA